MLGSVARQASLRSSGLVRCNRHGIASPSILAGPQIASGLRSAAQPAIMARYVVQSEDFSPSPDRHEVMPSGDMSASSPRQLASVSASHDGSARASGSTAATKRRNLAITRVLVSEKKPDLG